jgi:DNA uptake protein ComE-like DNA-binding protein
MNRRRNVQAVTCHAGSMGWDSVCDFEVQSRGGPAVRHREGIKTSWTTAVARTVRMPVDGSVLTEEQALQWQKDEQKRLAAPVNVRTATIADLQRIPRVDAYRAQVIHAAVRHGLVRKFDDLLKIEGIDRATLSAMRSRAYWDETVLV